MDVVNNIQGHYIIDMKPRRWVRRPKVRGTISHESALALYGLSDVSPSKVHITLPPALRIRRTPPAWDHGRGEQLSQRVAHSRAGMSVEICRTLSCYFSSVASA
jgi:predicted transcriptional regulator of viral defense system